MKIVSVVSARPNFVKLAAIVRACEKHPEIDHKIIHTGQHYDPLLSDVFFKQLEIPQPDKNLGVKGGGSREGVIETTAKAIEPVLGELTPNVVLVYGDVNGAVGAAKAAKKLGIQIGHVEAGLRSFDTTMPEEHNRIEIDQIADFLFCSEKSGMDNLEKEKILGKRLLVGNTMIDTLIRILPTIKKNPLPFDVAGSKFAIATLHRPSNVDELEYLQQVFGFLNEIATAIPIVLPTHPRTREALEKSSSVLLGGNVFSIDPLSYTDFVRQMKDAEFILTDSGGIQEEAVLLGKRCFTLRRNTERPSTIESGSNRLIDPNKKEDREEVLNFAKNPVTPKITIPPLWDGKAGERILDTLLA